MKTIRISKYVLTKNNKLFKLLNDMLTNNLIRLERESERYLYYTGDSLIIDSIDESIDIENRISLMNRR